MTIRALIVDDEPVARRGIRQQLRDEHDIEILAECDDGAGAVAAIAEHKPDLVFLDLQMPGLDGFDVIESVGIAQMPAVIFITAFDQFAVRAFEVNAIDYVLKPIAPERFAQALQRARKHLMADDLAQRLSTMLQQLDRTAPQRWSQRLAIRTGGHIALIETRDIDRCEAAGNYVDVHAGGGTHVVRETMTSLEARLDPARFVRISRSAIVNIERVRELHPTFSGDFVAVLADGSRVDGSRRFREGIDRLLR